MGDDEDDDDDHIEQVNTVNIRLKGNGWLDRNAVKNIVYALTGPGTIKCIYEIEKVWRVKFASKTPFLKVLSEDLEYEFNGEKMLAEVEEVFSNVITVTVSKVPDEIPDNIIRNVLSNYGNVKSVERSADPDGAENGIRKCKVILNQDIPPKIRMPPKYTGEEIFVTYPTRPRNLKKFLNWCYICHSIEHDVLACPRRRTCRYCKGISGRPHLEKDCLLRKKENPHLLGHQGREMQQTSSVTHAETTTTQQLTTHTDQNPTLSSEQTLIHEARRQTRSIVAEIQKEIQKQSHNSTSNIQENTNSDNTNQQATGTKSSNTTLTTPSASTTSSNTITAPILLIGDSQVERMSSCIDPKKVDTIHVSGGRFVDLSRTFANLEKKYEKIIIYSGTNEIKTSQSGKYDQLSKNITTAVELAKSISNDIYLCGMVPKYGRSEGPTGCDRINNIIKGQAWASHVSYIPRPECMSENRKIDGFFRNDMVHLTKLGANTVIDNINKIVEVKAEKLKRAHEKSPKTSKKKRTNPTNHPPIPVPTHHLPFNEKMETNEVNNDEEPPCPKSTSNTQQDGSEINPTDRLSCSQPNLDLPNECSEASTAHTDRPSCSQPTSGLIHVYPEDNTSHTYGPYCSQPTLEKQNDYTKKCTAHDDIPSCSQPTPDVHAACVESSTPHPTVADIQTQVL